MHPSSILSYYPTYSLLDEIVSYGDYDTLNIYMDLKNNLQTLYMEHTIKNIVENTIRSNVSDSSIFSAIISFLAFHKLYAIKRQLKINIFIFFETGTSVYHTNIRKKYKISRRIDDLYGLEREKRELFFDVCQKNLKLAERACNKLPNIKLFRLQHLEADFIPYYLISRNLVDKSDKTAHVVYSNDHDLLQCLTAGEHVYMFQKAFKTKRIVRRGQGMKSCLKIDNPHPDDYIPFAMAIMGDSGDDVDGVKGVGPKRASDMLEKAVNMVGGMDQLYDMIMAEKPIFDLTGYRNSNKYLNSVIQEEQANSLISENMRLVSFELLSRHLDDPSSVEMVKRRKQVRDIVQDCSIAPCQAIKDALNQMNVTIIEEDLDTIYFGT